MCEKTRQALENLPTVQGKMTSGTKAGLDIMLNELENTNKKINSVGVKVDNIDNRLTTLESANTQILKIVNNINDKITVNKIEQKAAQMDFIQRLFGSKFGKIMIIVMIVALIGMGVALVFLINNSANVAEIASAIKS